MSELKVALDPGFKRGQGWSCGNSFREAVPLRDGVGEEGLLSILGSVGQHIKGAGVGLAMAFLLVPCSWHVYLQQSVLEFVKGAESGPLPS